MPGGGLSRPGLSPPPATGMTAPRSCPGGAPTAVPGRAPVRAARGTGEASSHPALPSRCRRAAPSAPPGPTTPLQANSPHGPRPTSRGASALLPHPGPRPPSQTLPRRAQQRPPLGRRRSRRLLGREQGRSGKDAGPGAGCYRFSRRVAALSPSRMQQNSGYWRQTSRSASSPRARCLSLSPAARAHPHPIAASGRGARRTQRGDPRTHRLGRGAGSRSAASALCHVIPPPRDCTSVRRVRAVRAARGAGRRHGDGGRDART